METNHSLLLNQTNHIDVFIRLLHALFFVLKAACLKKNYICNIINNFFLDVTVHFY